MISRLTGRLETVEELTALVAVSGGEIAYEVMLPAFMIEAMTRRVGEVVTLTTFQYFESQGQGATFLPRLIGFETAKDRDFFELFTTVKGIGNRKALRAMAQPPSLIAGAIIAKDAKALTQLPEIGKRLAETVIAELHGKVDTYLTAGETARLEVKSISGPEADPVAEETILALVTLGETRSDAEQLVGMALARSRREGQTHTTADSLLATVFEARAR